MTVREQIEAREKETLSKYATLSSRSRGRERTEPECELRTCFVRDADRIIHTKAFRRLSHKTQVFLSPEGDHYRTRLTHTMEVSRIARTIARALRLNEDLTEAIALGHDLGHTPFGHAGERALDEVVGFTHNGHSLRVVDRLEKNGNGLNLSFEVRDGILCHTGEIQPSTQEGRIVRLCDKIAYICHDIDDAVRGDIISYDDIPQEINELMGVKYSDKLNAMVYDVIENSKEDIEMSHDMSNAMWTLRAFMFERVYTNPKAKGQEKKAEDMVKRMFSYFVDNPDKMPYIFMPTIEKEGVVRAATDYIAGMTDRYAVQKYKELYVPNSWGY